MKGFVQFALVVCAVYFGGRYLLEQKADAMVDVAASMARDGRYDEALAELDAVQSWLPWTQAAERVEDERKTVRRKLQARDEQARWESEIERQERRADFERQQQEAHDRALELAKARKSDADARPLLP